MRHEEHFIVQQIIPAAIDCHAVFSMRSETKRDVQRVPCFALTAPCRWSGLEEDLSFEHGCQPDLCLQRTVPCVEVDAGEFVPIFDLPDEADHRFIGVYYGSYESNAPTAGFDKTNDGKSQNGD
jgi:hypothetical protein